VIRLTAGMLARHTPQGSPAGRPAALVDIAQDILLGHLHEEGLFDLLVFKGGTALRKLYAGAAGRFSTDLDFAVTDSSIKRADVTALLSAMIDGYEVDGFGYRVKERNGKATVHYTTPFGGTGGLTTKVDIGPPPWLAAEMRSWVRMPVHTAYAAPPAVPVVALAENVAEKIARLNRRTPARDVYDLRWVATTSPHSSFDRALVRRLAILKIWVDVNGLRSPTAEWRPAPESVPFQGERWLRHRSRTDYDEEDIGILAVPPPDLEHMSTDLRSLYAFLAELDEQERVLARCLAADRNRVLAAIAALPGGRFAGEPLW
jgi:predicted nucleotidyltransferase component of viral defense system